MIKLQLDFTPFRSDVSSFAAVVSENSGSGLNEASILQKRRNGSDSSYLWQGQTIEFLDSAIELASGEVALIFPEKGKLQRFFRPEGNNKFVSTRVICHSVSLLVHLSERS